MIKLTETKLWTLTSYSPTKFMERFSLTANISIACTSFSSKTLISRTEAAEQYKSSINEHKSRKRLHTFSLCPCYLLSLNGCKTKSNPPKQHKTQWTTPTRNQTNWAAKSSGILNFLCHNSSILSSICLLDPFEVCAPSRLSIKSSLNNIITNLKIFYIIDKHLQDRQVYQRSTRQKFNCPLSGLLRGCMWKPCNTLYPRYPWVPYWAGAFMERRREKIKESFQ